MATSAGSLEKSRSSAYSEDLRWRMIWQRDALGYSTDQVAKNLCVDKSTVYRILNLFYTTGTVSKRSYPKERAFRKLTSPAQLLILQLCLSRPGIYLREIRDELFSVLEVDVNESAICKFLHNSGFTYQRLKVTALQQDCSLRQQFISDVTVYSPEMLVFIDETGTDRRNLIRKYGYSMRGCPLRSHSFFVRGERVSAIACISMAGLLDVKTLTGTSDGDTFYDFVQTYLLPQLMPYNGINPHSVVIMDNCSIHHVPEVVKSIQDVGALVHFLPPYSPDFAPIEETFSKVKQCMKSIEKGLTYTTDYETLLLQTFLEVTIDDCQGWIHNCGIYNV